MRTPLKATTLSLVILLGACSKRQPETVALSDDLKKDLAAVGSSGGDLATAPQSYQRMRFVSTIERAPAGVPAKRPSTSLQRAHSSATHHHAAQPMADVASEPAATTTTTAESPAPVSVQETPATAPSPEAITVAPAPAPEPSHAPAGSSGGGGVGDQGDGGGIGAVLGGIMGAVIRGGRVGVDKCDPRTDGRGGMPVPGGPTVLGMPSIPTTFPGGGGRHW